MSHSGCYFLAVLSFSGCQILSGQSYPACPFLLVLLFQSCSTYILPGPLCLSSSACPRLWALKPDFPCGGAKSANSRFFSFALGAFFLSRWALSLSFALFFLHAFALFFWLRARERKSAKARKKRRRPPLYIYIYFCVCVYI